LIFNLFAFISIYSIFACINGLFIILNIKPICIAIYNRLRQNCDKI
jgi:hypothetical protein